MNSLQYFKRQSQPLVLFLFLGLFVSCNSGGGKANSQSASAENVTAALERAPEVTFEKMAHDFGPILSGEKVAYNFRFTNTGNAPLIIISTRSGCGCTVGDYPKEPIPPGGEARVKVMFNSAGRRGFQSESVRVVTNATPQEYLLRITAEVIQN
jgi:hypothetical protein